MFYRGLNTTSKKSFETSCIGNFLSNGFEEAWEYLGMVVENFQQLETEDAIDKNQPEVTPGTRG